MRVKCIQNRELHNTKMLKLRHDNGSIWGNKYNSVNI